MASTPHNIKFESPMDQLVDSFASTPGTHYGTLFPDTPRSFDDESMFGDDVGNSIDGTPAPEKKPVKKRKSWGQQLPEPKTNLPPRKRAKTEDEKEQRRVERVLRNRRAAQSSRERKRQEVEALENEKRAIEQRNTDLEMRLAEMAAQNAMLQQQIQQITGGSMRVFQGSSAVSSPAPEHVRSPVTFSQDLFGSREEPSQQPRVSISSQSVEDSRTVNPASLSPEIRPVAESTNASSSDMTQHPAVSVGRTTALDELQPNYNFHDLTTLGDHNLHQHDLSSYFDAPEPSESDRYLYHDRVLPTFDSFDSNLGHLVGHNDNVLDDFNLDDFVNPDSQLGPEIQSSDSLAETTASLQPQLGASSYGCDDGGIAVSV